LPVGAFLADPAGCNFCREKSWPIDGMTRVAPYHTPVGEVLKRLKYARQQHLDRVLGSLLAAGLSRQPWLQELDALVPVPTPWQRRWQYGCHPVGLIARRVGRELGLPVLPVIGVRGLKRSQVGLTKDERLKNIRGVFHVRRRARLEGATLCVIDDVATTGATVCEMARVLKRAGAERVFAAVLGRAGDNAGDTANV
jgi:ComF family protein